MSTFGYGYSIYDSTVYTSAGVTAPGSATVYTVPSGGFAIIGSMELATTSGASSTTTLIINSGGVDGICLTATGTGNIRIDSSTSGPIYVGGGATIRVDHSGGATSAYRYSLSVIVFKNT